MTDPTIFEPRYEHDVEVVHDDDIVIDRPRAPQGRATSARRAATSRGTPLDPDQREQQVALPSGTYGLILFLVAFVAYFAIGYWFTVDMHVVVFDALDRLTRALMVWHNDPPKLAAIGFLFPPLTTGVFLPFALIKPLASSLVAIPLTTAIFAAITLVFIDRTMARCDMPVIVRLPLLAAFALNPMWVYYAGNGMSEAVYSSMLAFVLYAFVSWYVSTEPRYLIGSGFGLAFLVVTRYAFIIWAGLLALLIGVALVRRHASRIEVEGSVVAFAAPVIYALALWILFNALIVGDPVGWLHSTSTAQAVNAVGTTHTSHLPFDEVSRRLLQLNVGVFPLAFFAVPALVITFLAQRNDMALWLASFVVLGIVIIGVHAYASQDENFLTLRDSMPMYLASFVGAVWVYRSFEEYRAAVWAISLVLLIANLFTAWHAMKTYKYQSQEQAFTRAVSSHHSQEGTSSIGGYNVGIDPEAQMAQYIKVHIHRKNVILTDNAQTFGVMLLSGRPDWFYDRIDQGDAKWTKILDDPFGKVQYLLFTRNPHGEDRITARYPQLDQGGVPGMTIAYQTQRYTLVSVAGTKTAAAGSSATATTTGSGQTQGAQTSDGAAVGGVAGG